MHTRTPSSLPCSEHADWFTDKAFRRQAAEVCSGCPALHRCLVEAFKLEGQLHVADVQRQGTYWAGIYGMWGGVWFEPGRAPHAYDFAAREMAPYELSVEGFPIPAAPPRARRIKPPAVSDKPVPVLAPEPMKTLVIPRPVGLVPRAVHGSALIFGVEDEQLLGHGRHRDLVDGRAVAMGALRLTGMSLPAIARPFDRHHSTVLAALRRLEDSGPLRACVRQIHGDLQAVA